MNEHLASAPQARFYLLDQIEPSAARTLVKRISIKGEVSYSRLIAAIKSVIEDAPALRSSLFSRDGELYVRKHRAEEVPISVTVCDDAGQNAEMWESEIGEAANALGMLRAPFPHDGTPLARVLLLRKPSTATLYVAVHHAIFDDFSTPLLLKALAQSYERGTATSGLGPSHQVLQENRRRGLEAYWTSAMSGVENATSLPAPVDPNASRRRVICDRALDRELANAMIETARRKGLTIFAQAASAVGFVLSWCLGRDAVTVMTGSQPAWRTASDGIGCLQNTLPIHLPIDGSGSFLDLSQRVQASVLDAYEHGELPVEAITARFPRLRTALAQKPFSDVALIMVERTRTVKTRTASWTLSELPPLDTEYPLTVTLVSEDNRPLALRAEWPEGWFAGETTRILLKHIESALRKVVAESAEAPFETVLLDADDIAELCRIGTGSASPVVVARSVAAIADHATRRGHEVAVEFDGGSMTYETLLTRLRSVAAGLRRVGVAPGDRVALALPKNEWFIPTMLGILWAGATFVPIDAEHPERRIDQILSDAQPTAIVSDCVSRPSIPTFSPNALASGGDDESDCSAEPDQVSYIIYTSGTTGQPKGVQIEDRSLAHFVAAFDARVETISRCVVAAGAVTFDAIIIETFWPLMTGRRIILTDHKQLLSRTIPRSSVYECTPTVARTHLATTPGRVFLSGLNALLVTGEKVSPDLASALDELLPGRVYNGYGPTETTIMSHIDRIADVRRPTVGRPLSGVSCYLTDHHGRPTPPGWPGEVVIGGAGLARGYWRRDALTDKKFRPFPHLNLERGYASGDVAVLDRTLGLEVVGRKDNQTKFMGQRVEIEEIEACLRNVEGIADAAVCVVGTSLFAWVCASESFKANWNEKARDHLRESLPSAMVPTRIFEVPALPQLASGKLDRFILTEWAQSAKAQEAATPLGVDSTERLVSAIWSDVLGRDLGADDDLRRHSFFQLGGTSSGVIRVFGHLAEKYPHISLADLFTYTNLSSLTAFLNAQAAGMQHSSEERSISESPSQASATASFARHRSKETSDG